MKRTLLFGNPLTRRNFLAGSSMALAGALWGKQQDSENRVPPKSAGPADAKLIEDLVAANRILADQGVVDDTATSASATILTPTAIFFPARWLLNWSPPMTFWNTIWTALPWM